MRPVSDLSGDRLQRGANCSGGDAFLTGVVRQHAHVRNPHLQHVHERRLDRERSRKLLTRQATTAANKLSRILLRTMMRYRFFLLLRGTSTREAKNEKWLFLPPATSTVLL